MRKVAAVLLAGVLTLGAAVTAFASPSSEALTTPAGYSATVDSASDVPDGDYIIINTTWDTDEESAAASAIQASGGVSDAAVEAGISSSIASSLTLMDLFNLRLKYADDYYGSATLTFTINGVTASSVVYVLHFHNGAWEQIPVTLGTNKVTATFETGFSPMAILVDTSTLSTSSSTDSSSSTTASTTSTSSMSSPTTGQVPVMAVVVLIAAFAAAGIVVSSRRKYA